MYDLTHVNPVYDDLPSTTAASSRSRSTATSSGPRTPSSYYMHHSCTGFSFRSSTRTPLNLTASSPSMGVHSASRGTPQIEYYRHPLGGHVNETGMYFPLASPAPPTPIPEFRIYDLTHYIDWTAMDDDHGHLQETKRGTTSRLQAAEQNSMRTPSLSRSTDVSWNHSEASPTPPAPVPQFRVFDQWQPAFEKQELWDHHDQDFGCRSSRGGIYACDDQPQLQVKSPVRISSPTNTICYEKGTGELGEEVNIGTLQDEYMHCVPLDTPATTRHVLHDVQLSSVCLEPCSYNDGNSNCQIDSMVATRHQARNQLLDEQRNMDDYLFDRLCRGMQPEDLTTVDEGDRELEIRSCGTLPPDDTIVDPPKIHRKTEKAGLFQQGGDEVEEHSDIHDSSYFGSQVDWGSYGSDSPSDSYSHDSEGDDAPYPTGDSEFGSHSGKSNDASSEGAVSFSMVMRQREWTMNFLEGIFSNDQTKIKSVYYSTMIVANATNKNDNSRKGKKDKILLASGANESRSKDNTVMQEDFERIQDYCYYILKHLELEPIMDNIEQGVYDTDFDEFIHDQSIDQMKTCKFIKDLDACFELAMAQYEEYLEMETQKWNPKIKFNNEGTYNMKKRNKNLRKLAGKELKKQLLESDFKLHVVDLRCMQIHRRHLVLQRGMLPQ